MYGTDHAVPSPKLADLVDLVNASGGDVEVRLATLTEYLDRDRALHPGPAGDAPTWEGELRSGARANMLMNVISARVDLKAAAARAERRLERYAEPLAALHGTRLAGTPAGARLATPGRELRARFDLWLLARRGRRPGDRPYAEAEQIATGLVTSVLRGVASRLPAGGWAVVNPSPVDRYDVVELDLAVPSDWPAVAVRVGDESIPTQELVREGAAQGEFRVRGSDLEAFFPPPASWA
jgi:alpha-mannosidase